MPPHPWSYHPADIASSEDVAAIDRWWRATTYLSVGQIYLLDNPVLREPLRRDHVKPRLVGHWGTTAGLRSRDYVNVVVAGKQPQASWLTMNEAIDHCTRGIGIWGFASTVPLGEKPDAVMGAAGDVPTLEVLAAIDIIRKELPRLKVRMINVVDLMRLQPEKEHPRGLSDRDFDQLFTTDKPIIFNDHGYPWLIHRLTHRRTGHANLHARGYKEEGTTTPFDIAMMNDIDRYHLVIDVIDRVPGLGTRAASLRQKLFDMRLGARRDAREFGEDQPQVADWVWPDARGLVDNAVDAVAATGGDNK